MKPETAHLLRSSKLWHLQIMWRRERDIQLLILGLVLMLCCFYLLQNTFRTSLMPDQSDETQQRMRATLKALLRCKNKELRMERLPYAGSNYWLVRNFVTGSISRHIDCAASITYTTNGDYTFFEHLATLVSRWLAPVSFAIFAPGYDMNLTLASIQYVRECLPQSDLIRKYVSFHLYFPVQHFPPVLPLNETDAFSRPYNCHSGAPYSNVQRSEMYKSRHNLTYPINVGRNIARQSVNTHFVFACDIELFPSPGFVQRFLETVASNSSIIGNADSRRVFPIPVFEVENDTALPENKRQLRQLLALNKAIPFHSRICKSCHLIPNQSLWLNLTTNDELSVFTTVRREWNFTFWEPFYVSDNSEPMFDERVTWEGQKNKRIQGLAMCLLEYEYHVLSDGFLVHSPGIKIFDKNAERLKYVPAMNEFIKNVIEPEYRILFGQNKRCRV